MPKVARQWLRDILETVYQRRTVTRSEVAIATGLNTASVSLALQHLLKQGTIVKVGELDSAGGRRAEVLKLNAEAAYFVAVDLEGSRIRFALTNCVGDIRFRWEEDLEFGQELDVERVIKGIQMVLRGAGDNHQPRILAIGVSHPGIVDDQHRITAFNVSWRKLPLRAELMKAFDLPIFVEHGHRTSILAERWLGRAQGHEHCIYLMLKQGVGAGIFSRGHEVAGRNKMSGEIGHIIIDASASDQCNCGKRGCLEAIISSPNIVRQYQEKTGMRIGNIIEAQVGEVFAKARDGDPAAIEVLDRVGRFLGRGLAILVNLFNPEIIVLGGDMIKGDDLLLPRAKEELRRSAIPDFFEGLNITTSSLGMDIGLKGAASLAFRNSLRDPVLLKKLVDSRSSYVERSIGF